MFLALAACGSSTTPEPATVRARITDDLGNVLRETKAASDGTTRALPGSSLLSFATGALGGIAMPSMPTLASEDVDATIEWLTGTIFTDANYLGDGVYRFPAESLCKTTDDAGITSVDPDCVSHVDLAHARIRVEDGDGLQFWIQLGADHDEPINATLRHDEVALTVDLDDATSAMVALAEAFGEQAPNAELSGQVTAGLAILGPAHAKAALSFDRAIAVKLADQGAPLDGDTATRIASAAGTIASVELDATTTTLHAQLGLGETTAHVSGEDLALAGMTGAMTATPDGVHLDHVSFGAKPMRLTIGGRLAESIDLNPADGREVSLTVAGDGTLAAAPRLDLDRTIDHAVLGDEPPLYDVTRMVLAGTLRGDPSQLEVATGTFSLETTPVMYGFTATAGQCVTTAVTDHTEYSVGACR